MSDMNKTIVKVVAEMVERDPSQIAGETLLTEDLGIKSMNRIGLSALLEDKFNVEITVFDIMQVKSIDDLCVMVTEKQS